MFGHAAEPLLDRLTAGFSHGRDEIPEFGMPLMQGLHQRRHCHHFPQRHRMHPYDWSSCLAVFSCRKAPPHSLGKTRAATRLGPQHPNDHGGGDQQANVIEQLPHGNEV